MIRFLSIIMMCVFLSVVGCSGSDNGTADSSSFKGDLDPTTNTLDRPPTTDKLPADLRPPV